MCPCTPGSFFFFFFFLFFFFFPLPLRTTIRAHVRILTHAVSVLELRVHARTASGKASMVPRPKSSSKFEKLDLLVEIFPDWDR